MLLNLKMQILLQMKLIQTQLNQLNNNSQQNQIRQIKPKVDNQQAQSQPKDNDDNQGDALKTATQAQQQTLTKKEATTSGSNESS